MAATLRVSPAETLVVLVGGQGGTALGDAPGRGGTLSEGGAPGANAPDGAVTAAYGSPAVGGIGASGGVNGGGGGGGGFYGGGGGGTERQWTTRLLGAGQGGGGSSFGPPDTRFRSGVWGNLGDGWMTITYDPAADGCPSSLAHRKG